MWKHGYGNGPSKERIGYFNSPEECAYMVYTKYPSATGVTHHGNAPYECYADFGANGYSGTDTAYAISTCLFDGNSNYNKNKVRLQFVIYIYIYIYIS